MTVRIVQSGREYLAARYEIRCPAVGEWIASVVVTSDGISAGACEIAHDAGDSWHGTIRTAHTDGGVTTLDVRAGADGLDRGTTARHWANFTDSSQVLSTLAADAGETAATTATPLGSWRARGRTLRDEIRSLARWVASDGWRYALDGTLQLGAPSWADADEPGELLSAGFGWRSYACDALPSLAGSVVAGERVGVATYVDAGPGTTASVDLRAERLFPPSAPPLEGGTLEATSDGRATIRLDSGTVLGDVPLWFLPGVVAVVPAGVRVIVVDLGGDPRQPIAFAAPFDGAADELRLCGGYAYVLRDGDVCSIRNPDGSALSGPLAPLSSLPLTFTLHPTVDDPVPVGEPGVGHSGVKA